MSIFIKLLINHSPFDTRKLEKRDIVCPDDANLKEIIPDEYQKEYRVISCFTGYVKPENWKTYKPRDGEEFVISPAVKDPITIGTIVAAAAMSIGIGSTIATIIGVVVAVGWVVGLYLLTRPPKTPSSDMGEASPSYGWEGAQTMANPEMPVPIVYGRLRLGGNVIDAYTESVNGENYLYTLIALGEGEFSSIGGFVADIDNISGDSIGDEIKIEGNPISNLKGCEICIRMGADEQDPVPGFSNVHNYYALGNSYLLEIEKGGVAVPKIYTTFNVDCDELLLSFSCPEGLSRYSDKGELSSHNVGVKIEYRLVGAPAWTLHEELVKRTCKTSPYYFQSRISNLTPGQYEIQLSKLGTLNDEKYSDKLYLSAVDEIKYNTLTYPGTAMIAIKIKATEQLSGSFPQISVLCDGLKVNVWNGATDVKQFSRNPIWCMRDLIEAEYGLKGFAEPYDTDSLNILLTEAAYCDVDMASSGDDPDIRFTLNYAIDTDYRALDLLQTMATFFRASIIPTAGQLLIKVEKPETPVQLFTMGNIVKGSFVENFMSRRECFNCFEIEFNNEEIDFRKDIIALVNTASLEAGDPFYKRTISLPGVTSPKQATRICNYLLKASQLFRAVQFKAGMDAIICQPSDVVNFAHNLPVWGIGSGRVKAATNSTITLYENITFAPATTYWFRVRLKTDVLVDKQITSPAGIFKAGTPISIAPATWGTNPADYDVYTIGEEDLQAKPFRLVNFQLEESGEVELGLIEYDADVYDDSTLAFVPIQYSQLPDPLLMPADVEDLTLYNSVNRDPVIFVDWHIPDWAYINDGRIVRHEYGLWDHGEIYLMHGDTDSWTLVGQTSTPPFRIENLIPGDEYTVRVVSVTSNNKKSDFDTAPEETITVKLDALPRDIKGLELFGLGNSIIWSGKHAKFRWKEYSSNEEQFLGEDEDTGLGGGPQDLYFQDYRVEIWVGGLKVREEYVKNPEYIYTYEKNVEDGGPNREFTIKVWARDSFNQQSLNAATLTVNNPQCATPTGLAVGTAFKSIFLQWSKNTELDLYGYVLRRSLTPGFSWATGTTVYSGSANAFTDTKDEADPPQTTYYYRVAAFDLFDDSDMTPSGAVGATTGYIEETDIAEFAITASKIFTKIPILESDAWQDDTPVPGSISWNEHFLYYNGVKYTIAAGSSDKKFVYWVYDDPGSATVWPSNYHESEIHPTEITGGMGDDDHIIATNLDGAHDLAWNAMANLVVGSAYIMNAAILNAHIQDLAVDNAKISSLDASKINTGFLSADRIQAGTIALSKIDFPVNITFFQEAIPESQWEGDLWFQPSSGLVYRADSAGATTIASGEWVLYLEAAAMINTGVTLIQPGKIYIGGADSSETLLSDWSHSGDATFIDGGRIYTHSILADSIYVTSLDALTAIMGDLTSGSITLDCLSPASGTTNKLRMDENGIYVSHDDGGTWKKFLAVDGDGKLTISFDYIDDDDQIIGTKLRGPTGWTNWDSDIKVCGDDKSDELYKTSSTQEIEIPGQGLRVRIYAKEDGVIESEVEVYYEIYEEEGAVDRLIYTSERKSLITPAGAGDSEIWDTVVYPCNLSDEFDFFPGDSCYVKFYYSSDQSGMLSQTSHWIYTDLDIHTLGYVDGVYKHA